MFSEITSGLYGGQDRKLCGFNFLKCIPHLRYAFTVCEVTIFYCYFSAKIHHLIRFETQSQHVGKVLRLAELSGNLSGEAESIASVSLSLLK